MKRFLSEWNRIEHFHKLLCENNPLLDEGVKALLEISKFAKKNKLKVPRHPSFNVRFESNAHYDWLIKVNKLVKIFSEIPNYKPRIKRFFNNDDYLNSLSALYELEMALKFKLQGFETVFTNEKTPDKKPDIEIKLANRIFNLEVTTINNPDKYREKQEFYFKLVKLKHKYNVKMAGILVDIPNNIQNDLLQKIEEKTLETKDKGGEGKMVIEGKLNLEIGSTKLQGFALVHKELKDIEDKVIEVIRKKTAQFSVKQNPGILCIYTGSRTYNIEQIYTKAYDKINLFLQTIPNLSVLVLSQYSDFYRMEPLNHLQSSFNFKTLCTLKPGFGEIEQSLIWQNKMASTEVPSDFIQSYETFEDKLDALL
ncbi:MAG: hypothetical protein KGD64_01555 [Candidatus Heimdallarchaeota archaeon]|nr:hypothetical protein [Candidatus Heimdallarchaeota archaeon]